MSLVARNGEKIQTTFYFSLSAAKDVTNMSKTDESRPQQQQQQQQQQRKKESILELSKFLEKSVRIKFAGGRECAGVLKGFDPLLNVVLDNCVEFLRDPDDPFKVTEDTRQLGLVVCRGTAVVLVCPTDGMEAIANPFVQQE